MANHKYAELLKSGVSVWNKWKGDNPEIRADLRRAYLIWADLREVDLSGADLRGAWLRGANFREADLRGATLSEANLSQANLSNSNLVETKLLGTDLSGCNIYGISVWNTKTDEKTKQNNLVITPKNESIITVDNLEVAQFIYLMLNNRKIRDVINTISNKAVLILGKFGTRLINLDAIRVKLRELGFLPILFDFEKPTERDTAETIITLAGLAKFVIADLTEPKSIPLELKTIVSNLPTLPVQLLLKEGEYTFGMIDHIVGFNSISGISRYTDMNELLDNFQNLVIDPIEEWKRLNRGRIEAKLKFLNIVTYCLILRILRKHPFSVHSRLVLIRGCLKMMSTGITKRQPLLRLFF